MVLVPGLLTSGRPLTRGPHRGRGKGGVRLVLPVFHKYFTMNDARGPGENRGSPDPHYASSLSKSLWPKSLALMATMTVESDMMMAPAAGDRTTPTPASTPAASGIVTAL